jgi:hypothetical protein
MVFHLRPMHWFTTTDGTRFAVQSPLECARSLEQAFSDRRVPATAARFMAQLKKECAPPGAAPKGSGRVHSSRAAREL